ncbi:DUF4037 domain-containing protein [Streptosporangium sp. NPDC023615]|uniref:DUF4037 domain-containing protein n=1 Tax=Streptosporangium sp. NPDC023615 TaxID=3154794 RepID=UPI003429A688
MMSSFIPGLELSRTFYRQAVRPIVTGVAHSAALIGAGSEVLAFDTERSTDHDWGPRVVLFVAPGRAGQVRQTLEEGLPEVFCGYRTGLGEPRGHRVQVSEAATWFTERLGFDPLGGVGVLDWLSTPWQRLAEVTGGEVFHDGLGVLEPVRAALRWYPPDVERYVLAGQWRRLARQEAFPGRCGEVGDELGSALVTAELARDLMCLLLLTRRRYPPYAKWLGSAFARMSGTAEAAEELAAAVSVGVGAGGWRERHRRLGPVYRRAAALHNRTGRAAVLDEGLREHHRRPFPLLEAGRFAEALRRAITDDRVRALPPVGSIDQFAHSSDLLTDPRRCRAATRAVLDL